VSQAEGSAGDEGESSAGDEGQRWSGEADRHTAADRQDGDEAYRRAGVDYGVLDAAKLVAQRAALATSPVARRRGATVEDASRGEPATLVELGGHTLAVVLECLGTKSSIARSVEAETGADHWAAIGYDTVAAAVNDCCCVGALPITVGAYFATGTASWYQGARHASLVDGFGRACQDAGAAWVGGASPTLGGVVEAGEIDLAASVLGVVPAGACPWRGAELEVGDEIVLVGSSGLHANGASLARRLVGELPKGWATPLPSGRQFGAALLEPSLIYAGLVEALLAGAVPVHYASHITGHGLRKLMRADAELTYQVSELPEVPEVLAFLSAGCRLEPREAYGTLNMGVGYALFCATGSGTRVVELARSLGLAALVGGTVQNGPRRVVLEPVGVEFAGKELELR
jgi:phosphoribosylformylglycinamidine cyclo-ligase